jgi:glycosyltransferase involved in cell wall biosynthesis
MPALTVGLPVYNGEVYLRDAMDALLRQTYTDFELVISDNASTDSTAQICQEYAANDERIRYVRQPENIGAAPNHNVLVSYARGRYFKWASHDDLYAPTLLEACIAALDDHPEAVLAHCADAVIDETGAVVERPPYLLDTHDPRAAVRLRSLLRCPGGNDFYGVIRTEVLRNVRPHGTYYNADRTFMAGLVLAGPFAHVPETLYFRREHDARASRATSRRARSVVLGPDRRSRLRHPMVRIYAEYLAGFVSAVRHAPLSRREKLECLGEVAGWLGAFARPRSSHGDEEREGLREAEGAVRATPPRRAS